MTEETKEPVLVDPVMYEQFMKYQKIVRHALAESLPGTYFICGEGGKKDDNGLPETIQVCPAYGADTGTITEYVKVERQDEEGST